MPARIHTGSVSVLLPPSHVHSKLSLAVGLIRSVPYLAKPSSPSLRGKNDNVHVAQYTAVIANVTLICLVFLFPTDSGQYSRRVDDDFDRIHTSLFAPISLILIV